MQLLKDNNNLGKLAFFSFYFILLFTKIEHCGLYKQETVRQQ